MSETPHPHAVFWIDLEKITPNPYQPRKFFDPQKLQDLSDSIRRYGVLQPIVVTRMEEFTQEGGMVAKYEIIAGERRFRASKLAGLEKIPAIIREGEQTDQEKLELAILENLQREDLNPVDKARSFNRLVQEFDHTHAQVAEALGKSREYVSNSLRLLQLPDTILDALSEGKISEGHTRPLLMLRERPDEQMTLFMQMTSIQGMTVRAAEKFARSIATEKQRKNKDLDPEMKEIQSKLASHLGTKVSIDKKTNGGKLTIEFGNKDDLRQLFEKIQAEEKIIRERIPTTPQTVASTAAIGLSNLETNTQEYSINQSRDVLAEKDVQELSYRDAIHKDQQTVETPSVEPAYTQEPARTFTAGFDTQNREPQEPQLQVENNNIATESTDISDLQKEIYSLAHSAAPDTITPVGQKPQEDQTSKFAFHQEVQSPVVDIPQDFSVHTQTTVDMVSDTPIGFGVQEAVTTEGFVQPVSMGSEFVPERKAEPLPQWDHKNDQEGMTTGRVSETDIQDFLGTRKETSDDEVDLYKLDDFSI